MIPRFHCPFSLTPGAQVELPEPAAHHALRVLRMQVGDTVILFDGHGGEWRAEIVGAGPPQADARPPVGGSEPGLRAWGANKVGAGRTARVILREFSDRACESPLHITLAQALPSGDKMDWVVEKGVELGVAAIQPIAAKRSVLRLSGERMGRRIAHWNHIASAACEQCGRNRVPVVAPVLDLPHYLAQAKEQNTLRLLLAPETGTALTELAKPSSPLIVLVGPEGGWEAGEMQAAQTAGFQPIRLGPRILRTETAGAAVLAALQAIWGDF